MRFSAQACQECEWWRCRGPSTARRTFDRTSARKLPKSDRRPNIRRKLLRDRRTQNPSAAAFSRLSIGTHDHKDDCQEGSQPQYPRLGQCLKVKIVPAILL